MQDKKQKTSPIKQRILLFVDYLKLSKREFYEKTGISRGTLESSTGITEEIVARFIATYPDVSPEWLLVGAGPMLKSKDQYQIPNEILRESEESEETYIRNLPPGPCEQCKIRDKLIAAQSKTIEALEARIADLEGQKRKVG